MDLFRKLFGFPVPGSNQSFPYQDIAKPETFGRSSESDRFSEIWCNIQTPSEGSSSGSEHAGRNFNVFSDPLEIHRYFEEQMDQFFKSFAMSNFGNFAKIMEHPNLNLDESLNNNQLESYQPDSREQFLKKGYMREFEQPIHDLPGKKIDKDVDGKLTAKDINDFFNNSNNSIAASDRRQNSSIYHQPTRPIPGSFFYQSVEIKTRPDGSVETRRTDSEGNDETTITQKLGDKEYTIIRKRDRDGNVETHENINVTETQRSLFDNKTSTEPFSLRSWFNRYFK
ncbi:uncharacterized protein [Euwallacea fornicatus]|uniref:uncharacterized protein n=1 Tax=Euwallacea fornicatus TaxID=995702 RepID=UPI00338D4382